MRLIFLYVASRRGDYFARRFKEEGYFELIRAMVKEKIIDRALIFIDGKAKNPFPKYERKIRGIVLPDIYELTPIIEKSDVIWTRGGFKPWALWLEEQAKAGHWLLIYAANTGRARWKFWDVIFDDLGGRDYVDKWNRVFLDFRKPVNERIFRFQKFDKRWDVCIGASRIHDRKGQWRAIDALIQYKAVVKKEISAVLPGPWARGVETNEIREKIKSHGLHVDIPGSLSRSDLNYTFNSSGIAVFLGSHGQGDRGPMEALRCGCPLLIGFPKYHAPWLIKHRSAVKVCDDPNDSRKTAFEIDHLLHYVSPLRREFCSKIQTQEAGIREVGIPRMKKLFDFIAAHPKTKRRKLIE